MTGFLARLAQGSAVLLAALLLVATVRANSWQEFRVNVGLAPTPDRAAAEAQIAPDLVAARLGPAPGTRSIERAMDALVARHADIPPQSGGAVDEPEDAGPDDPAAGDVVVEIAALDIAAADAVDAVSPSAATAEGTVEVSYVPLIGTGAPDSDAATAADPTPQIEVSIEDLTVPTPPRTVGGSRDSRAMMAVAQAGPLPGESNAAAGEGASRARPTMELLVGSAPDPQPHTTDPVQLAAGSADADADAETPTVDTDTLASVEIVVADLAEPEFAGVERDQALAEAPAAGVGRGDDGVAARSPVVPDDGHPSFSTLLAEAPPLQREVGSAPLFAVLQSSEEHALSSVHLDDGSAPGRRGRDVDPMSKREAAVARRMVTDGSGPEAAEPGSGAPAGPAPETATREAASVSYVSADHVIEDPAGDPAAAVEQELPQSAAQGDGSSVSYVSADHTIEGRPGGEDAALSVQPVAGAGEPSDVSYISADHVIEEPMSDPAGAAPQAPTPNPGAASVSYVSSDHIIEHLPGDPIDISEGE